MIISALYFLSHLEMIPSGERGRLLVCQALYAIEVNMFED